MLNLKKIIFVLILICFFKAKPSDSGSSAASKDYGADSKIFNENKKYLELKFNEQIFCAQVRKYTEKGHIYNCVEVFPKTHTANIRKNAQSVSQSPITLEKFLCDSKGNFFVFGLIDNKWIFFVKADCEGMDFCDTYTGVDYGNVIKNVVISNKEDGFCIIIQTNKGSYDFNIKFK